MALRSQTIRRKIRENIASHSIVLFFLGTLVMIPCISIAGGLYINEFGTPSIGGFYVHSLSDKWKLGANLITLTGAILDYDDDWTGRYLNTEVTLLTVTFYPSVA